MVQKIMTKTMIRDIFLKKIVEYLKKLFNLHSNLPFLLERKKIRKCNKLVCTVEDKENYAAHIRALNKC